MAFPKKSMAADKKMDKKKGIKEGSKKDTSMDKGFKAKKKGK